MPQPEFDRPRQVHLEIEGLANAAHHIGLDLEALKVEQLELEAARLAQVVHSLQLELTRLRAN
jgi:hypothetical protein